MDWENDPELVELRRLYTEGLGKTANALRAARETSEDSGEAAYDLCHRLAGTLGSYDLRKSGRGFELIEDVLRYGMTQGTIPSSMNDWLVEGARVLDAVNESGSDSEWNAKVFAAITSAFESLPAEAKTERA
jgi:hypothetical protein